MTAFLTTTLNYAFLGQAYETSFAVQGGGAITALSAAPASGDTGLPPGLTVNAAGTISGTPTGAASTPNGTGVAVTGEGVYTFTLANNSAANPQRFTLYLFSSRPRTVALSTSSRQAATV
jgi:hypothetical protein